MTVPCLNCTNRKEACHSTCEKYKDYKAELPNKNQAALSVVGYWSDRKHRNLKQVAQYRRKHS